MNKALFNDNFVPSKLILEVRPIGPSTEGGTIPPGGRGGLGPAGPGGGSGGAPPTKGPPKGAVNLSLVTSTGGLQGSFGLLVAPMYLVSLKRFVFGLYDYTDFDCEEDCIYNFKIEDVRIGRNIDIHKVYIQYRDIGKVKFTTQVQVIEHNRSTGKNKIIIVKKVVSVGGLNDRVIYEKFIDLKVSGARPQLQIIRKANNGSLNIIRAMLIGNSSEEDQL